MTAFSQIRAVSLREQVAERIRTAIIEGQLKPNDHIVETALTQQFGVSRTPVREALILLERESLVVSIPNRGSFVRTFNEDDIEALFSMRTTLENFAGELIIDHLTATEYAELQHLINKQNMLIEQGDFKLVRSTDMAFHQSLVNYSQHPHLMRNWQEIVAQIAAVLYLRGSVNPIDEYRAIADHQNLLDAYKARDIEQLRQENRRINQRVAAECKVAVQMLQVKK